MMADVFVAVGRQNDLLMQPAQTSLLNKNAPPIMHKESPILIKQGSLDKNKAAKNKVCDSINLIICIDCG